jgi:hypothetical protein
MNYMDTLIFLYQYTIMLLCWYLHLVAVGELEYPNNLESYAAGSLATSRVTLGGQAEG